MIEAILFSFSFNYLQKKGAAPVREPLQGVFYKLPGILKAPDNFQTGLFNNHRFGCSEVTSGHRVEQYTSRQVVALQRQGVLALYS